MKWRSKSMVSDKNYCCFDSVYSNEIVFAIWFFFPNYVPFTFMSGHFVDVDIKITLDAEVASDTKREHRTWSDSNGVRLDNSIEKGSMYTT